MKYMYVPSHMRSVHLPARPEIRPREELQADGAWEAYDRETDTLITTRIPKER